MKRWFLALHSLSDTQFPGRWTHVEVANIAWITTLAFCGIEAGRSIVGVDAEQDAKIAGVQLHHRRRRFHHNDRGGKGAGRLPSQNRSGFAGQ